MLLENRTYPGDVRVRREAESLAGAGYGATVVAPRGPGQRPASNSRRTSRTERWRSSAAASRPWERSEAELLNAYAAWMESPVSGGEEASSRDAPAHPARAA